MRRSASILLVLLALLVTLAVPAAAAAWTTDNITLLSQNEDNFLNYDCESRSATSNNVDWPVTFVFWGNATVAKVDQALSSRLPIWGIDEYMYLRDARKRFQWVSNTGVKSFSFTEALHLRLYGAGGVCLTNKTWGRYVLGTCHLDINELTTNPTSGYSEDAATRIAAMCAAVFGAGNVQLNAYPMGNAEPDRAETHPNGDGGVNTHYWQSDGYATLVYVP